MNQALLTVKNLKKYFPVYAGLMRQVVDHIKAVDGVDFSIHAGKVLGLVGESGSGKSTAARAAIRLIEPTAGEIVFDGEDFLAFNRDKLLQARRDIQIIFQDPYSSLNPRKTIRQIVGEALVYHHLVSSEQQLRDCVEETLKKVGLSPDIMERYPHQFSGGQQQRICIARAIAVNPRVIICDEAVSALDVSVQAQILNLLMELKDSLHLSYLFISHDLSVVRYLCDDVAVMHTGKIVEKGEVEKIFLDPKVDYTKKLLSSIPITHPLKRGNVVSSLP